MSRSVKIVVDSSADRIKTRSVPLAYAPLKIVTADKIYVDDATLDVEAMANDLYTYKGKSSTSCPNPNDWISAFGDAEEIYCLTITATLSGSYNAACVAKEIYESEHQGRRVFVLNTLSTGPEMALLAERIEQLIDQGEPFDSVCQRVSDYCGTTELLFMLKSMKNLANNGRISSLKAFAAGLLGIQAIGRASEAGDLEMLDKCRGENNSLAAMFSYMKERGYKGGKTRIAHCINERAALRLRDLILAEYPQADVTVYLSGGLCTFYAEKGGLLVGYEA